MVSRHPSAVFAEVSTRRIVWHPWQRFSTSCCPSEGRCALEAAALNSTAAATASATKNPAVRAMQSMLAEGILTLHQLLSAAFAIFVAFAVSSLFLGLLDDLAIAIVLRDRRLGDELADGHLQIAMPRVHGLQTLR